MELSHHRLCVEVRIHFFGWVVAHSQPYLLDFIRDVEKLYVQVLRLLSQQALVTHLQLHHAQVVLVEEGVNLEALGFKEKLCKGDLPFPNNIVPPLWPL